MQAEGKRRIRDVVAVRDRFTAGGTDLGGDVASGIERAAHAVHTHAGVVNQHLRATRPQEKRVRPAKTVGSAGNHGHSPIESNTHRVFSKIITEQAASSKPMTPPPFS